MPDQDPTAQNVRPRDTEHPDPSLPIILPDTEQPIEWGGDLNAWCRREHEKQLQRDARLDFSPIVKEHPKLWRPDPDWEIWLFMSLDEYAAKSVLRQVRNFSRRKTRKPIWVSLNSAGGLAGAGIAIYSLLREMVVKGFEVSVMVYGCGNSAASLALQAASEGRRFIKPEGWILIHSPRWSSPQPATRDDRRMVRQMKRQFCEIYAGRTGKSVDRPDA